jgi:hypothetical protein
MNQHPLEQARDADIRLSKTAMHRAASRTRENIIQTGTRLVICRDGIIQTSSARLHCVNSF